jgi:S-ribosylhomocysteine lyase LuxS involved in autoinducer biosynthesis
MFSNLWVYFHVGWGLCSDGSRLVNGRSWGGDGAAAHLHGFGSGSIDPVLVMFDCLILSVFCCWSVPGTNRWVCAWYNLRDLCLAQYTQSVPGTIHAVLCLAQHTRSVPGTIHPICAWYNTPNLCLAQYTQSVPGTIHAICSWHNTLNLFLAQHTQSVPGTIHPICSWHNTRNLFLAQHTRSVPGTIHAICAWHNTPNLCLAQKPTITPGTTAKYENALLFPLTTCIYMNRIIVYLVYTTEFLNDVSGYF